MIDSGARGRGSFRYDAVRWSLQQRAAKPTAVLVQHFITAADDPSPGSHPRRCRPSAEQWRGLFGPLLAYDRAAQLAMEPVGGPLRVLCRGCIDPVDDQIFDRPGRSIEAVLIGPLTAEGRLVAVGGVVGDPEVSDVAGEAGNGDLSVRPST